MNFDAIISDLKILSGFYDHDLAKMKMSCFDCFPPHVHNALELIYVIEGSMKIVCDIGHFIVYPGELLLFNPLELHGGLIDHEHPRVKYVYVTMVLNSFRVGLLPSDNRVLGELIEHRMIFDEHIKDRAIADELGKRMIELAELYIDLRYSNTDDRGRGLIVHGHAAILLGLLISRVPMTETVNRSQSDFVIRVRSFVDRNYMHEITADDILREFSYSHSHFCRLFKSRFGISFSGYLRDYRLSKALYELSVSEAHRKSISEVALSVGFTDYCYFTHLFKKHYGVTPSEYRNMQSLLPQNR